MLMSNFGIIFMSCLLWIDVESHGGAMEMNAIHKKLLQNYNPSVPPSLNYSKPMDINIALNVAAVLGLDTKKQLLHLRAFLRTSWTDELLQWDPKQYGGIDRILAPQNSIWKPDLILHNAANEMDNLGNENVFISVTSKGLARWEPPFYLEGTCKLDMSKYPFDTSICPIDVYPWMSDNRTLRFQWTDNAINLDNMLVNGEYEITPVSVTQGLHQYENLFFDSVTFTIQLARRPAYVSISLLIPVNLLSVLNILSFTMRPGDPEKVNISITILLSFTVFLSLVDSNMPPNSDNISLMVTYIAALLLMSFLSVVGNILVCTINSREEDNQTHVVNTNIAIKDKSQRFKSTFVCGCGDPLELTEEKKCDSYETCAGREQGVTSKICRSIYRRHTTLSLKLNRAFLIASCITLVFLTGMLVLAIII